MAGHGRIPSIAGFSQALLLLDLARNTDAYQQRLEQLESRRQEVNALLEQCEKAKAEAVHASGGLERLQRADRMLAESQEAKAAADRRIEQANAEVAEMLSAAEESVQMERDSWQLQKAEKIAALAQEREENKRLLDRAERAQKDANQKLDAAEKIRAEGLAAKAEYEEKSAKLREAMGA